MQVRLLGGDRDGNPFVTAEVTRRTLALQAEHAALSALRISVERVGRTLTADQADTPPSRALQEALARDGRHANASRKSRTGSPGEPHRQRMLVIAYRLQATGPADRNTPCLGPMR